MSSAGFEPAIPVTERHYTHALDHAATAIRHFVTHIVVYWLQIKFGRIEANETWNRCGSHFDVAVISMWQSFRCMNQDLYSTEFELAFWQMEWLGRVVSVNDGVWCCHQQAIEKCDTQFVCHIAPLLPCLFTLFPLTVFPPVPHEKPR
jgi:hypothetical protein